MKKIVIVGDSITAGWRNNQTSTILKDKILEGLGEQSPFDIILKGVPGEITTQTLERIDEIESEKADAYFIFFGANDASMSHNITPNEFKENLLALAIRLGLEKVVYLTPPRCIDGANPNRTNAEIERFRTSTIEAATAIEAPIIDVYEAMKTAQGDLLVSDGVHFTEQGYDLLAQLLVKFLKEEEE